MCEFSFLFFCRFHFHYIRVCCCYRRPFSRFSVILCFRSFVLSHTICFEIPLPTMTTMTTTPTDNHYNDNSQHNNTLLGCTLFLPIFFHIPFATFATFRRLCVVGTECRFSTHILLFRFTHNIQTKTHLAIITHRITIQTQQPQITTILLCSAEMYVLRK